MSELFGRDKRVKNFKTLLTAQSKIDKLNTAERKQGQNAQRKPAG
jgi:hypothetical protein